MILKNKVKETNHEDMMLRKNSEAIEDIEAEGKEKEK